MVVELDPRVHILAKRDWFHGGDDSLLRITNVNNLTVNGNGALLQMRRDDYAQPPRGTCPTCRTYGKAEWRCGIWLQHSNGVTLRGLNVIESGGDGIIVGPSGGRATNTHIVDCVFDRNYRQGMSVINAENLTVVNTIFSNTAGTAPAAGVDLEPDHPSEDMTNVTFKDCSCVGNAGGGFQIYLGAYNASARPFSVGIKNMQITGGGSFGFGFGGISHDVRGGVAVEDSVVQGTPNSPVMIFRHKGRSSSANFTNCRFLDSCGSKPTCAPINLNLSPGVTSGGNISFTNCEVVDSIKRPWLAASPGFTDVTATGMVVKNPNGCTIDGNGLKVHATCELDDGVARSPTAAKSDDDARGPMGSRVTIPTPSLRLTVSAEGNGTGLIDRATKQNRVGGLAGFDCAADVAADLRSWGCHSRSPGASQRNDCVTRIHAAEANGAGDGG
jgi:hypothetical protein